MHFSFLFVRFFRPAPTRSVEQNVTVDFRLTFNESDTEPIPPSAEVIDALKTANVSHTNDSLELVVDTLKVISEFTL